jgi:hypothetical protein
VGSSLTFHLLVYILIIADEHMSESTTHHVMTSNRRADPKREAMFSALELFVNGGDSLRELQVFRMQHQDFFPARFYDLSEELAQAGKKNYFNWYKRMLRVVWEGRDLDNVRLGVLLGVQSVTDVSAAPRVSLPANQGPARDFQDDEREYQEIFDHDLLRRYKQHSTTRFLGAVGPGLGCAIVPDWRSGALRYDCEVHFQFAVYDLMRESWRARVCPICRRYMIAEKPGNFYCSVECAGAAKRKRDLEYWRTEGSKARTAKKRSPKTKKRGRQ